MISVKEKIPYPIIISSFNYIKIMVNHKKIINLMIFEIYLIHKILFKKIYQFKFLFNKKI